MIYSNDMFAKFVRLGIPTCDSSKKYFEKCMAETESI